jgi:glucose/arabinose dehydrogenase
MRFRSVFLITALLIGFGGCDNDDDDPVDTASLNLNMIAEGFTSPVLLVESTDNTGRLFIVEQLGQIYIIKNGEKLPTPFLDIQDKIIYEGGQDERGLLGLAFHPQFSSNGRFFVYYSGPLQDSGPDTWDHTNYVAEYTAIPGNDVAEAASGKIVLAMDHPQSNHNGGMIAFGSDGFLYISVGDGGGGNDVGTGHVDDWYAENAGGNGQDITQNLLGSILRIDVSTSQGYTIPSDNPFVDKEGLDEIFAYGLRNPYRFCLDPENRIILADAGQELYEEIDLVENGDNLGWNVKEGNHCFDDSNPATSPETCPAEDAFGNTLKDPVIEIKNSRTFSDGLGNVSVGGFVCENSSTPSLDGKYIFGVLTQNPDAVDGAIFAADRSGDEWSYEKINFDNMQSGLGMFVLGFGKNNAGEVYVLTSGGTANSGKVFIISSEPSTD